MKPWVILGCSIALVLLMVLGAGCAGTPPVTPTPTPATTQTTAQTPVTTIPTTANPMEPQPTVTPPNSWTTILTVSRNPISYKPNVIVIYGGGTGQLFLQQLEIFVIHPDGRVETETIPRPPDGSIPAQTEAVFPQTVNEPVRVQIIAMYNGIEYPVYDQVLGPV